MSLAIRLWPWLAVLLALAVVLLYRPGAEPVRDLATPETAQQALGGVLGGDAGEFARAIEPREFRFPDDHGPHPAYRNEWWYVTAHLHDPEGQRVTLMLTFFRFGLSPEPESNDWRSSQVYMAHFALLDQASDRHLHGERLQRAALGLAGAERAPYRVWLQDWSLVGQMDDLFPATLQLKHDSVDISLSLQPAKPPVLQGEQGLSQKSAEPGNASYYYAYTRLHAEGQITLDGQSRQLTGQAWMDREFGSSALAEDQIGWDWFSLQLSNGHELMIYQMRRADGSIDPYSHGAWIDAEGNKQHLPAGSYQVDTLDYWQAADGRARYPARWRIQLQQPELNIELAPLRDDQEMRNTRFRYYEGAIDGQGQMSGQAIKVQGFVEMTGHAEQ